MARGSGKSGQQVAEEHVATLVEVLVRYAELAKPLPRFHCELNRSALAAECGFDRKIFTSNPRCAALIQEADEEDRKRHLSALDQAELAREERSKTDEDRTRLESRVLFLEAENQRLRAEVQRFRVIETLMTQTGKLP